MVCLAYLGIPYTLSCKVPVRVRSDDLYATGHSFIILHHYINLVPPPFEAVYPPFRQQVIHTTLLFYLNSLPTITLANQATSTWQKNRRGCAAHQPFSCEDLFYHPLRSLHRLIDKTRTLLRDATAEDALEMQRLSSQESHHHRGMPRQEIARQLHHVGVQEQTRGCVGMS